MKPFPSTLSTPNHWNDSVPVLQFENVSVWRDSRKIVGPLDLQLFAGEIMGVFGLNSCGKSTMLRAAGGLLQSGVRGSIRRFGRDSSTTAPNVSQRIGQQIQSFPVIPHLTVLEQLGLVCRLRNPSQPSVSADVNRVFDAFPELYSKRSQRADCLNGGSLTMLSVGLAMVGLRRGLLLLDEPTNNLSAPATEMLSQTLRDNLRDEQNAVLVVSHDRDWLGSLMSPSHILMLSPPRPKNEQRKRTRPAPPTSTSLASSELVATNRLGDRDRLGSTPESSPGSRQTDLAGPIFISLHSHDLL